LPDVLIRLLILGEIVKTERCKTGYGEKSLPRVKSVVPRATWETPLDRKSLK
jgi:hypothetical protein